MAGRALQIARQQLRFLLLLLTPAVFGLMALVSLHLFIGTTYFRDIAQTQLNGLFAGEFSIQQTQLDLDPRRLHLYGVTLRDSHGEHVFTVQEIDARVDVLALLGGTVRVAQADLRGGRITLDFATHDTFNLTDALYTGPPREAEPSSPEEAEGGGIAIALDQIRIYDADIRIFFGNFVVEFFDMALDWFSLDLAGRLIMNAESLEAPRGVVEFQPEMFGFSSSPQPGETPDAPPIPGREPLRMEMKDIAASGWRWDGEGFRVKRVGLVGEGATITLEDGALDLSSGAGFAYEGTLEAKLPPDFVGISWFAGPLILSPLEIRMEASGYLGPEMNDGSTIGARLHMNAKDLKAAGLRFDQALLDGRLVNRRFYLADLVLQGYGGEISLAPGARGGLPEWLDPAVEPPASRDHAFLNLLDQTYNAPLVVEGVALERVLADVAPFLDPSITEAATGRLRGGVRAWGRLIPSQDRVTLEPVPAWHRAVLDRVELARPAALAASPRGMAPVQRVVLDGEAALVGDILTLERPLEARMDQDVVRLERLWMGLGDEALPVEGEVSARIADLGRWARYYGVSGVGGGGEVRFGVSGPLLNPTIREGALALREPRFNQLRADVARARFGLESGKLRLASLELRGEVAEVEASGTIQVFGPGGLADPLRQPRFDLEIPRGSADVGGLLRALEIEVPVEAQLTLQDIHLTGTPASPKVTGTLQASEIEAFGESLDGVEVLATSRDNRLEIERLEIRKGRGVVLASGSFDDARWLSLRVLAKDIDAASFANARALELSGALRHLSLEIDGLLALDQLAGVTDSRGLGRWLATQRLDIRGSLALWELAMRGQRLGHLTLVWDTLQYVNGTPRGTMLPGPDATLTARQASVRGMTDPRLSVEGIWLPAVGSSAQAILSPQWREVLEDRGLDASARPLADYVHAPNPAMMSFSLTAPLSADNTTIRGQLRFRELDVRSVLVTAIDTWLETQRDGQVRALEVERTALRLSGGPRRRVQRPLLPMEEALQLWRTLELTGDVEVLFDRDTFEYGAYATLSELAVEVFDRRLTNDQPILINYDGNKLNVDLSLGANAKFVHLTGDVTPNTVGLRLSGFLDMRLLNFLPTVLTDVQGVAEVELSMRGLWERARPSGYVRFLDGRNDQLSFRLRAIGQQVNVERGKIEIINDRVVIREETPLQVRAFDGSGRITGSLELRDGYAPGRAELTVSARNMLYTVPGTMSVTFNTDLTLEVGSLSDPSTWLVRDARPPDRPGVQLVAGRFTQNIYFLEQQLLGRLTGAFGSGRNERFQESAFELLGPLKDIALDVTVVGRDSFFVRNEIETIKVDMELKTYFNLRDTVGNPNLSGSTLEIIPGGTVRYQGEDFTIRQGIVAWKDELTNPEVDIIIEVDIQNTCGGSTSATSATSSTSTLNSGLSASATQIQVYHILVKLQGQLSNLRKPELTSSPFADERDILTLIATRCTTDQLSGSLGGVSGAAVGLALRPWVGKLEDWLTQVIPVDELSIDSDGREARVGVQKRLSERVVFNCAFRQGEVTAHQCGLQVIFRDNLFLEFSERNEGNEFKLDGKLKLRVPLD